MADGEQRCSVCSRRFIGEECKNCDGRNYLRYVGQVPTQRNPDAIGARGPRAPRADEELDFEGGKK